MPSFRPIVIILLCLSCLPAWASKAYTVRDQLINYSVDFADNVLHSSSEAKSLGQLKNSSVSDSTVYNRLRLFGRDMFVNSKQTMAYEYFKEMLDIIGESKETSRDLLIFKAYCYLLLGTSTDEVGMNQLSMDYYLKGLKLAEKFGSHPIIGDFYNNIGVSYTRVNNYKKAEEYFTKALNFHEKYRSDKNIYIYYNNLSEIRMMAGDFDGAIDYALKAAQCLDEKEMPVEYYSIQTAIGSLYLKKKEYDKAATWLTNANRHLKLSKTKADLFETSLKLMSLYAQTNEPDSLAKYRNEATTLVDEIGNPALRIRFLEELARLYHTQGDDARAYETSMRVIALKDSSYQAENLARMEQAHSIYEIEKSTIEKKSAIEKWNPVVVFFTMGSVVVVMVALLVWIMVTRRKAERVRKEKDRVKDSLAQLRELRLSEERVQKEKTQRELDDQQRRLTTVTLEKIKTSQQIDGALTEVKQVLQKIPPRDRETRQRLRNVIAQLEGLDNESNWNDFQHYFTLVHPDFYRQLDDKHPDLTPKDRKTCALIALGLSTKDIAALTFREVRSVETARNRLRKKLGLSPEINLEDYMHHFAIGTPTANADNMQVK